MPRGREGDVDQRERKGHPEVFIDLPHLPGSAVHTLQTPQRCPLWARLDMVINWRWLHFGVVLAVPAALLTYEIRNATGYPYNDQSPCGGSDHANYRISDCTPYHANCSVRPEVVLRIILVSGDPKPFPVHRGGVTIRVFCPFPP